MQWYALHVQTGAEDTLGKLMNLMMSEEDFKILVPKRLLIERRQGKTYENIRILFPGYVFIYTDMNSGFYYKLKKIPRLLNIIKSENEPVSIRHEEMATILSLTRDTDTIGLSGIYVEGDSIKVVDGPLKGMEGIIEKFDKRKKRARISFEIMGQVKRVDLGARLITSLEKE